MRLPRLLGERREDVHLAQARQNLLARNLVARLRRRVGLEGAHRRGETDLVAVQRVPDRLADVGVDAVALRVVARVVLDLVDDRRIGERADAREARQLARDAVHVRGGLADDVDHRGRRDVVVDAELQDARVEIAVRKDFQPLAGDDGVGQDDRLIVEAAHPRGAPAHALDDADVVAGVEDVADVERAFHVQRDAAEEIAERVLKRQADDRGQHGAAGERGRDVDIENGLEGACAKSTP